VKSGVPFRLRWHNRAVEAPVTIALAQTNPSTGDLDANAARIAQWCSEAARMGAELVVFPELALTGYGADDLLLRRDFLAAGASNLAELARETAGITALVGFAEPAGTDEAPRAYNSVAVLADGGIRGIYRKRRLTGSAGAAQADRFLAGSAPITVPVADSTLGILAGAEYGDDSLFPATGLIAVSDGTPYVRGGARAREATLREAARRHSAWLAVSSLAGARDELIFEGASVLVSPEGEVTARAGQFTEELLVCRAGAGLPDWHEDIEELYQALVTGIREYVTANGFTRIGLGLSGGLDSALVAALASDAIGGGRVSAVVMPSRHSSRETQSDAREMAGRLGCELLELPVEGPLAAYEDLLGDDAVGVSSENLQARIRGNLLMALSNRRGWLVLATGNRSEAAVGYATLYGDLAGGLAPIQDVPKTVAFELCRYRNGISPVIPDSIIERPPSAELKPGQRDSDALPEYDELDRILGLYLDRGLGAAEIADGGEDPATVAEVISLVERSEYKRRQAPPGLRVSGSSFTRDRRMPLTNGFARGTTPTVTAAG